MTDLEQEVADCYRGYHNAFVQAGKTQDATLLRPFTHIPLMTVAGGQASVIESEEKSDARWSRILANLPADYDHSVAHSLDVTMISTTSALVTVDVSRFKKDGKDYDHFCASYVMVKTEEGWRLTTWLVHDSVDALRTSRL